MTTTPSDVAGARPGRGSSPRRNERVLAERERGSAPSSSGSGVRDAIRLLKVAVAVTRDRRRRDVEREKAAGDEPRALPDWVPEAEALLRADAERRLRAKRTRPADAR